ncbi:hydrogenase expression/formation protein HypE [Desulfovibrio litoralis]|uniref:Hydrogenase maturation protein, carbamoyl dehydratase HypE n=1 Tax=Desulfovibrio litoralis DSM 11393 TaxID=1121455 RepID=A0A1M7SCN3_9BACT|nr:hydrogenase expression/formation protein HypE [Desulfovibrio litoralis]SHN56240.1 Hydrogenase maturation protein, carbamoyl dehydratase HypE [Desulfovibrio litoralis DSM 11393]
MSKDSKTKFIGNLLLDYGSGGQASHRLINDLFLHYFDNPILRQMNDAAELHLSGHLAISTDSYTVTPLEFKGGNIGSLAVHGTVNDVAMLGSKVRYLSTAFILEEGLDMQLLERIVKSMAEAAKEAEVLIVTGDTKVVPKGAVDKIFINTTGLGEIISNNPPSGSKAQAGDVVLISGTMGDHGLTIMAARENLPLGAALKSDSAPLNLIIEELIQNIPEIHVLRDPTRGGLATTLNEITMQSSVVCKIEESLIPVLNDVKQGCSILGLDPLYLANEGKLICILPKQYQDKALEIMHKHKASQNACYIGEIFAPGNIELKRQRTLNAKAGQVLLETPLGGTRLLSMLEGEQLPRIC